MPDSAARQLALLAHHRKAAAERVGERRGDEKAARFDADQKVRAERTHRVRHALDRCVPSLRVREQRRDVVEQDPGLRKIGDRPNVLLQIHDPLAP